MRGEGCLQCQTIARLHGAVKWYAVKWCAVKWCAVKWYAVIWYAVKWCAAHEACLHKGISQKGRWAREALSESAAVRQQACVQPLVAAVARPLRGDHLAERAVDGDLAALAVRLPRALGRNVLSSAP